MPYTPPTARAAVTSPSDIQSRNRSHSFSASNRGMNRISGHASREKADLIRGLGGDHNSTAPGCVLLSSAEEDPWKKAINSMSELSTSVSPFRQSWKYLQSKSDAEANTCPASPRDKLALRGAKPSGSESSDSEDENLGIRASVVHKKSGEIVPSALRPSPRMRRHQSLPEPLTCQKAVHFQENDIEHIRLFLRADCPTAARTSSLPAVSLKDESWELHLSNFPPQSLERSLLAVRIERVFLSPDTKVLIGIVAVSNLGFSKSVVVRFTLDHWTTTSEVAADFDYNTAESHTKDGCDRFVFKIRLEDQTHLQEKTMHFCVRYNVELQEYWDNNDSNNYQVNFSRSQSRDHDLCKQTEQGRVAIVAPSTKLSSNDTPAADLKPDPRAEEFNSIAWGRRTEHDNQRTFNSRYNFERSLAVAVQAGRATARDRENVSRRKQVLPVDDNGFNYRMRRVTELKCS